MIHKITFSKASHDATIRGCHRTFAMDGQVTWKYVITASVLLAAAVLFSSISACAVGRHPVGIVSETSPLASDYTVIGPVEDSSCRSWFLGIPLGGMSSTGDIIEQLVREKGGDALIGVTVEYVSSVFALPLVGNSCTIIKGQAVRGVK